MWRGPNQTTRFVLAVFVVGLTAAGFAVTFRVALSWLLEKLSGSPDVVSALSAAPPWLRLISPALGGLVAGGIGWVLRNERDHGVGGVMEAVALGGEGPSMRVTLLKSLASFAAIASGGSLGREGPIIQLGAAAGKVASRWLDLHANSRRALIAAGAAAGFAAAYNTPFAAVLFVLEIVLRVVVLSAVVPVMAATVLATALTRLIVGAGPVYGERVFSLYSPVELLGFAGLGVVAALGAQGFMRLLGLGERLFTRHLLPLPWRPALGGLAAGLLVMWLPEVAGNGYEPLNGLLDGKFTATFVATLLIAKCLATTASVSSGSPGGVFTPTLLIGGSIGFLYFGLLHSVAKLPIGPAGGYALVGMAAATAASTHAPLMAAVMAFELSGDYAIVLPLLLSTAIATAVSRRLRPDSIYSAELRRRGVSWEWTLEGRRMPSPPDD